MKNSLGFTFIELMVSICIFGILSAIAMPNMISWRNNAQFNSAVRQVKIAIEETRMDAIKANMPSRIDFNVGGNSYDRVKWNLTTGVYETPVMHELPSGVTISGSTFAADQLEFTSRGLTVGFGNGRLILQSSAGQKRQILVASTGSSRIQ